MQIQGVQKDLLPGDPVCAPAMAVMAEAFITLLKNLQKAGTWTEVINDKITSQLDKVTDMEVLKSEEVSTDEKGKDKGGSGEKAETGEFTIITVTLLHSEWPKLYGVLTILSAVRLRCVDTSKREIILE